MSTSRTNVNGHQHQKGTYVDCTHEMAGATEK